MPENINTDFEKEIYSKYYTLVSLTCSRRLIQKDLIDDAVQSTFLLYIKEQDKIKSNLSTWFYWASKNVCIVMNRRVKDHVEINDNLVEKQENQNDISLDTLIASLPKKKREVLLMKYYDNMSNKEIAEKTQSKESSIKKTIERTIYLLQSKFKKKDVLVTALLAQLFHINKASASTINSSSFILQNSLIQQSIVKGVLKMYVLSKLKITLLSVGMACIFLGGSIFLSSILNGSEKATNENLTHKKSVNKAELFKKSDLLGSWKIDLVETINLYLGGKTLEERIASSKKTEKEAHANMEAIAQKMGRVANPKWRTRKQHIKSILSMEESIRNNLSKLNLKFNKSKLSIKSEDKSIDANYKITNIKNNKFDLTLNYESITKKEKEVVLSGEVKGDKYFLINQKSIMDNSLVIIKKNRK
ncbi:MAG: hypothetical protein COA79_15210 [Planctomycetota bacterium]|nr:MAG: hypothetical protein COA79_15210 [Planctomycetota bacterium]